MNIALLEDEPAQARFVQDILQQAGHGCTHFAEGRKLLAAMQREQPFELLLIDWEIPDLSGLEVLRWVRYRYAYSLPVLFITNRTHEEDIVAGLKTGADDYMTKPVRREELLARIDALSRRYSLEPPDSEPFSCSIYDIDPRQGTIAVRGVPVVLAPKEYELAALFFRNPGRLFSRDVLAAMVWKRDVPATSRTLDTHLSNIRQKLKIGAENGVRLTSSYALGYRLEVLQTA